MKKNLYLINLAVIIFLFIFFVGSAMALDITPNLQQAGLGAEYNATSTTASTIPQMVGLIVRAVLSFVGAIFFILIIFSGIQWMTAGGNEEKITKARTRMTNAAIGLAITTAAYFITWFISQALLSNV